MAPLDKLITALDKVLTFCGGLALVGMICLTCFNIGLRLVWFPVRGTFELMGFFGALTVAFALGFTQLKKGHISVDILVDVFPAPVKRLVRALNSLLLSVFIFLCAWQLAKKAGILWETGEVTETLEIVYYPFTYAVALGCAFLALVFLADLLKALTPAKGGAA